jgi:ATP-dependent Clp protease ATP-binding subunit ClpA
MFERFTDDARQTVVRAQDEARRLHHGWIGTEHLLLGLLDLPGSPTAAVLIAHGLSRESVSEAVVAYVGSEDLDEAALTTLGIDLAAVRSSAEAAFGPGALRPIGSAKPGRTQSGHIPFTGRAKKVLELSLREALALKSKTIADGHIALGLLREGDGLAMRVIADRGIDTATLREEIQTALRAPA